MAHDTPYPAPRQIARATQMRRTAGSQRALSKRSPPCAPAKPFICNSPTAARSGH